MQPQRRARALAREQDKERKQRNRAAAKERTARAARTKAATAAVFGNPPAPLVAPPLSHRPPPATKKYAYLIVHYNIEPLTFYTLRFSYFDFDYACIHLRECVKLPLIL